jgi:DNA repair exonuclease SbcCD nuclease subunit
VLAQLKQAHIPVIAIEGNHDKAFIHSENPTWLNYLAEDDLLILLRTPFDATGPLLKPWDQTLKTGSFIDLLGVRFVGAGYLGAATPHKVREIVARLEPGRAHVLLLHAGPEYFVGEGGGFSSEDLENIRQRVCYLALGHIHKPMKHEDWACNPGSLEHCDLKEASVTDCRGFAIVELDPARNQKPLSIEIRDNPRRPVYRLELDCTEFGNKLKRGADALVDRAVDLIKVRAVTVEAVIDLKLTGVLNLDRIALDQAAACAEIAQAARVRAVALDTSSLNLGEDLVDGAVAANQELRGEALERSAILELVNADNIWGLDGRQQQFADFFFNLKEAVRAGRDGESVAEQILQSPLLPLVKKALEEQEHRQTRDERDKWKETGESAAKGFDAMLAGLPTETTPG